MIKANLVTFLLVLITSASDAFAVENLGFCHEYLTEFTYEIVPGRTVSLSEDQILVRGELEPFHEQGMEDQTMWSVFERHLFRSYESAYSALFGIQAKDKLYILSRDNKTILYEGYFNEFGLRRTFEWNGQTIHTFPNRPQLYSDPELKNLILDHVELAAMFQSRLPSVVIQSKSSDVDYEPYRYVMRLKAVFDTYPGRFTQITPHYTYERAFGENIVEVTLKKSENPFYAFSLKRDANTPAYVWEFVDLDGTQVQDYQIKKVLGFDLQGMKTFELDMSARDQNEIQTILQMDLARIFVIVQ